MRKADARIRGRKRTRRHRARIGAPDAALTVNAGLAALSELQGALLAASMAAWLHQLTAGEGILHGHGVRAGKAMIATLLPEVLARLRDLPAPA